MIILFYTILCLFLFLCLVLTLLVLIQKGRGGGLSGAFGGGGGGSSAFGSKTGDVLTWATSIIFGLFIVVAVTLNLIADHIGHGVPTSGAGATPIQQPINLPSK